MTSPDASDAPIGLFDSGVGGLTVLTRISETLPAERFLYLADQKHVPYGDRRLQEIESLASRITDFLISEGAKAVVMACNVSSATALPAMRQRHGDRVLGVIDPGVEAARAASKNGRIGVLATASTVRSKAYSLRIGRGAVEVACPKLVPLIESGDDLHDAAEEYLAPLLDAQVDTVILGCTHYPFALPALETVSEGRITFVDPAEATATALAHLLEARHRLARQPGKDHLMTTGPLSTFVAQAGPLLADRDCTYGSVAWPLPGSS